MAQSGSRCARRPEYFRLRVRSVRSSIRRRSCAGVEEAARHGIRVAVHAHGTDGIMASLRAGVASIEHGTMLTSEAIALMKERGVWLVPQAYLMVEGGGIDPASLEPAVRRKLAEIEPRAKFSYEQAIQSGVKIAFSTDGPLQKNDLW